MPLPGNEPRNISPENKWELGLKLYLRPSRALAVKRRKQGASAPRIYDPKERWALGLADFGLSLLAPLLKLTPGRTNSTNSLSSAPRKRVLVLRLDRLGDLVTNRAPAYPNAWTMRRRSAAGPADAQCAATRQAAHSGCRQARHVPFIRGSERRR